MTDVHATHHQALPTAAATLRPLLIVLACLALASPVPLAAQPLPAQPVTVRDIAPTPANSAEGPELDPAAMSLGAAQPSPGLPAGQPPARHGTATRAAAAAATTLTGQAQRSQTKARSALSPARPGVERAVFDRLPVRVALPIGRERLVTLPGPVALHVPDDIDQVARIESIDRMLYITALRPFTAIRVVAEAIDGGRKMPLDLVADASTAAASPQLEVFVRAERPDAEGPSADASARLSDGDGTPDTPLPEALDMVQLTRYAARMLYAPRRLAVALPQVQQLPVPELALPHLVRGVRVEAVPLGQWRSGALHVTALRVRNLSAAPVDLPLDQLRGTWLAVTAQHGRLGPAGGDTDTTALYLVCERAFEACL